MVEIIREGSLPGDREHTTDCRNCQTKFRFKRSEAKFTPDQRDGDALVIDCPLCGQSAWVAA